MAIHWPILALCNNNNNNNNNNLLSSCTPQSIKYRLTGTRTRVSKYTAVENTFYKCIYYNFSYCIGLDQYLLQMKMLCCKANVTTDVTLHRVRNYVSLYFIRESTDLSVHPKECYVPKYIIIYVHL